jgi:heme exporter protein B
MTYSERHMPGLLSGLIAVARRDLLLAWKRPGDVLNPLFFFAMVCTLFPLAVGPSADQLTFSGPGVLWVAALLAMLISLNSLFISDFDDGSLEQLLVSPQPLPLVGLGKTISHWLTSGLPLVLVSPIVAITYRMPGDVVIVLMMTLTLGTISLSLLGSIGAALTVGLHRGTALLSLLILPLSMPVLAPYATAAALRISNE